MKSTGIVRRIDELGRLVLPSEIRQQLELNTKKAVEIFTDGDLVILKKYQPGCIFCENTEGLKIFCDKLICSKCLKELQKEF